MIPAGLFPFSGRIVTPFPSGLVAWHDAQQIAGKADGDALDTWPGLEGLSHHLTKAGATSALYRSGVGENINGHACVRIVADATCYFTYAMDILSAAAAGEVFVVAKNDADPAASEGRSGFWSFGTSDYRTHHPYTDGKLYEGWGRYARVDCGNPTANLAAMHVHNVSSQAAGWTVYLNGSVIYTTGTNTVNFGASGIRVGRSSGTGANYAGVLGELVVFNRALSGPENAAVYATLAAKWAP
jgi:hypothetical protein